MSLDGSIDENIIKRKFNTQFFYHENFQSKVPYCPAVTPPLFATDFQEKEGGGGRNNEDLRFRLTVKPPSHEFAY